MPPVITFLIISLLESLFPFRECVLRLKHYGKNLVFAAINSVITGLSGAFLNVFAFSVTEKHHLGLLNAIDLSPVMETVIAILIFDCWIYAWHRLNHRLPFLWRFHQVHHNDINMDTSTALRFHPGEVFISSVVNIGIFILVGIRIEQIVLYKAVFHANVMIHHSNVNISPSFDRWLRFAIVTPNMHRVHHSMKREETDSNYSSVLTIWDRLFGSYRESDPKKIMFGLKVDRESRQQTLAYLLTLPFKRIGRERENREGSGH